MYYRPKASSSGGAQRQWSGGRSDERGDNEMRKDDEEASLTLHGGSGHDSAESRSLALASSLPQCEGEEPPWSVESLDSYGGGGSEQQEDATVVAEVTDGNEQQEDATVVAEVTDGNEQQEDATVVTEVTDGNEQQEDATVVAEVTDGNEQQEDATVVTEVTDGNEHQEEATVVTEVTDGNEQQEDATVVTEVTDGNEHQEEATVVTEVTDGNEQQEDATVVTEVTDGNEQQEDATVVTEVTDRNGQQEEATVVTEVTDGNEQQEDATVVTEVTEREEGEGSNRCGHPPFDGRSGSSASVSSQEASDSSMVVCVGSDWPRGDQGELSRTKDDGRGDVTEASAASCESHDQSHGAGISSSASLASERSHLWAGRGKRRHAPGKAQSDDRKNGESADDGSTGSGGPPSREGKEEQTLFRRSAPPSPFDPLAGILGGRGRSKERRRVTWSQDYTTAYIDRPKSLWAPLREATTPPLPGDCICSMSCPKIKLKDIADSSKAAGLTGSAGAAPPVVSCTHDMSSESEGERAPSMMLNSSKPSHSSSISWESEEEKQDTVASSSRRADSKGPSEGPHPTSRLPDGSRTAARWDQKCMSVRSMRGKALGSPSSGSEDGDDKEEEEISGFSPETMPSRAALTSLPGYKLGRWAKRESHMIIPPNARSAINYVYSLESMDFAFVRRRSGEWTYAIVADRPLRDDGPRIRFVVDEMGSTKTVRKGQWADGVRLVNNGLARISYDLDDDHEERIAPSRKDAFPGEGGAMRSGGGQPRRGSAREDVPVGGTAPAPAMPRRRRGAGLCGRERPRESLASVASDVAAIGPFARVLREAGHQRRARGARRSPVATGNREDGTRTSLKQGLDFDGGRGGRTSKGGGIPRCPPPTPGRVGRAGRGGGR